MLSESPATRKHTYAYSLRTAYTIGDFAAFHWIVFVRGQATTISAGGGAYHDTLRRPPLPITVSARGPQGNPPLRGDRYCSRCHDARILFVRKSHRFCVWSAEEEASLLSHDGMKERGIYEKAATVNPSGGHVPLIARAVGSCTISRIWPWCEDRPASFRSAADYGSTS